MPWITVRPFFDSLVQYEIGDEVPERISSKRALRAKYLEFRAPIPGAEVKKPPEVGEQTITLDEYSTYLDIKQPISLDIEPEVEAPKVEDTSKLTTGKLGKLVEKEDSIAVLSALLDSENQGKKRKGAIAVIQERIDELREKPKPSVDKTPDPIAVSNLSIAQIKKLIVKEKNIAVLNAMLETESRGKKRSGAINAIEIRINQLKEE
jgi:hypothetical protein